MASKWEALKAEIEAELKNRKVLLAQNTCANYNNNLWFSGKIEAYENILKYMQRLEEKEQ